MDVETSTRIARPRQIVAAYAVDPATTTTWYANIDAVDRLTPPPLAVGSELAFRATFLGRRLDYTYRVTAFEPGELFVMSTAQGPFPMETTYRWDDLGDGGTLMRLRNRGEPAGFAGVATPLLAAGDRRADRHEGAGARPRSAVGWRRTRARPPPACPGGLGACGSPRPSRRQEPT